MAHSSGRDFYDTEEYRKAYDNSFQGKVELFKKQCKVLCEAIAKEFKNN